MRLLKYLAYILMVCVALVIGGGVFLVNYVNPNDYKAEISKQVAEKTGKTLIIKGNISWSFFPWLGIVVQDVELKSLAKIQEAAIEVKVLPLLYKKVEVGSLKIKGLDLNLVKNAQGVGNWESITQSTDKKNESSSSSELQKAGAAFAFIISNINISNTRVVWNDQQTGEKITLRDLTLQTKNIQLNKSFPVSLSVIADVKKFAVNIKTEGTVDYKTQTITLSKLSTVIGSLVANGQLKINNFSAPTIQGDFQIPDFNPREFLNAIGEKTSPYDATALKNASASFNISIDPKNTRLSNLKVRLDETTLLGNMDIKDKNANLQATLDTIHLDRYLESKEKPAKLALSNVQINATTNLDSQNTKGILKIGALQAGDLKATAVNAPIAVNNKVVTLDSVTAQFYQGRYNGTIQADLRTPETKVSSRQSLTGIQLEPLLHDLKKLTQLKVSGAANLDTQFTATGKNTEALTRSLNGQVKFAVNNGVLQGIDIDHVLSAFFDTMDTLFRNVRSSPMELFQALSGKVNPALQGGTRQTKFSQFTGNINIANGQASNNDLLLKTPTMTVTGNGTANLVDKTINYRLNASKINPKTNKPYDEILPILINGPFADPKMGIDPNFINQLIQREIAKQAKSQIANVVTEQAKKHLGDEAAQKLGEQLQNLNLDKLFR